MTGIHCLSGAAVSAWSQLKNKRVLITGGLGFIGSNLACRLVALGAEVTVVDSLTPGCGGNLWNVRACKKGLRIEVADIRDSAVVAELVQRKDYLFNLAGQTSHVGSMNDPFIDLDVNARAQLVILEACRRASPGIKVVYASSRQLYGVPAYFPVDERHPVSPVDVNGINKFAGEQFHVLYSKVYGIRSVIFRLTNTYGPHMRVKDGRQTFLGIWIRRVLSGDPIEVFGSGEQLRDFCYVDDVVDALLLAAVDERSDGGVFNLGDAVPVALKDVASMLVELNGSGRWQLADFPADRKVIDIGDYFAGVDKARKELGWAPKTALREGLARTLEFYREHCRHYW